MNMGWNKSFYNSNFFIIHNSMHQKIGHFPIKTIQKMEQQNAMTSFTNPIIDIPLCQICLARKQ
jgi:hypothetical protein